MAATTAPVSTATPPPAASSSNVATRPTATTPDDPAPTQSLLALAKKAAASAPTTVAAIPTRAGPVPVLLPSGATPAWPYQRYWISGEGRNNGNSTAADNPRLDTVAYIYNFAKWAKRPTGVTNSFNDGSKADYWTTSADYGGSQAYVGIRTNSRYVAMPSEVFCMMSLIVDGKVVLPGVD